jgi:hypothetical protein
METRASQKPRKPATYWNKQKQAENLVAAFEKWTRMGVWSVAAAKVTVFTAYFDGHPTDNTEQVHADQMAHVQKGCLERKRQDIASDGSRIEGSHKGWNSLQRTHASGIVMFEALAHDFVLRRNLRIGYSHEKKDSGTFLLSTRGSHHISLVDHIAELWNVLVSSHKRAIGLPSRPRLPAVDSGETFGIVNVMFAATLDGMFEVKREECEGESWLLQSHSEDEAVLADVLDQLSIDAQELAQPLVASTTAPSPTKSERKSPQAGLVQANAAATALVVLGASAVGPGSEKCKPEGDLSNAKPGEKRARHGTASCHEPYQNHSLNPHSTLPHHFRCHSVNPDNRHNSAITLLIPPSL